MSELWNLPGMYAMREAGIMKECECCGDPVLFDEAQHGIIDGIEYDVLCVMCAEDVDLDFYEEEEQEF